MVTLNLEQQALEFLAVEYERDGKTGSAHHIRTQPLLPNKSRAVRAIVAALRQQPAPVGVPGSVVVLMKHLETLMDKGKLEVDAIPTGMWNAVSMHNFVLAPPQPAPVVDDARMARALEWVRALTKPCSAEEREMLGSIEEAVAAYNPNCGGRTVRVVDDALRKDAERYRWLRENAGAWEVSKDATEWTKCETGEKFRPRVYFTAFSTGYGGMLLDDALDAARAQGVQS